MGIYKKSPYIANHPNYREVHAVVALDDSEDSDVVFHCVSVSDTDSASASDSSDDDSPCSSVSNSSSQCVNQTRSNNVQASSGRSNSEYSFSGLYSSDSHGSTRCSISDASQASKETNLSNCS